MTKVFDKLELLRQLGLQSNPIQDAFVMSDARFKIFRAARRVGKSFTAAKDVLADVLMPGTRGWIIGPSYELADKEFRYIHDFLIRANKKLGLPLPEKVRANPKAGDLYILTPWGSEVVGKTADKPQALVGEELDWLILSEAASHNADTWGRYLRPTLITRAGRAIFPTTPDISGKWLYDIEMEIGGRISEKEWKVFTCAAWDAGHISKDEIESVRQAQSEDYFLEQVGGEWIFYVGRVFKAFNPAIHIIEPFDIPANWPMWEGIDYGARDATAVMFLTRSPSGSFYFFDEYYANDKPTIIHCENVMSMETRRPNVRVSDHHALGKQLVLDWGRYGLPTVNNPINRKSRRDRLMALLEPRPNNIPWHITNRETNSSDDNGKYPSVFIFKGKCPNFTKELMYLKWKEGSRQEGTLGDTIGADHAIDAAEYITSYVSKGNLLGHREKIVHVRPPSNSLTGY